MVVGWVNVQALAPLKPTHHLPQTNSNGMPWKVIHTMVGRQLAKARFDPPYKCRRSSRRVGQCASPSAAKADPPSAANKFKRHALESRAINGGSATR